MQIDKAEFIYRPKPTKRPPGLHQSDVIKRLLQSYGLGHQSYPGRSFGEPGLAMELGSSWDTALDEQLAIEEQFALRNCPVKRPKPIFLDAGYWASPDGMDKQRIWEYKLTWGSLRKFEPTRPDWLYQMQGYCVAYKRQKVRLVVFFVMGDYAKIRGPVIRSWDYKFTKDELKVVGDRLAATARDMQREEKKV